MLSKSHDRGFMGRLILNRRKFCENILAIVWSNLFLCNKKFYILLCLREDVSKECLRVHSSYSSGLEREKLQPRDVNIG